MTRPDLDALAALLDKATPGSLKAYWKGAGGWTIAWGSVFAFDIRACGCKKEDTALIVAAVNALPGIIARVRELERERDEATLNRACANALVSAAQDMTQAAALAMRERCAQACEERALIYDGLESGASTRYFSDKMRGARTAAEECAAAIRALEV